MKYELLQLRAEMEAEKQKSMSSAIEKLQQEHKEVQRKAEATRKEAHELQIMKLVDQHRLEISETKKKQWVSWKKD